jgi:hypothetical protein
MEGTKILLTIPHEFDKKLNEWITELKYKRRTTNDPNKVKTKADLIIKFAIIGFNTEVKSI